MIRQDWSTLKKLMFAKTAAGGAASVEDTATGNPLTFQTDLARPLKSLLIPFTPQQEGTGDPSPQNIRPILPWNGLKVFGGGKNLLNPANRVASGNNVQYYRSGNRFLLKGGQTYTLSANVIPAQTTMYKGTNTTVASTTSASLTYTPTENVEVWFDFYVPNARLPEGGISAVYGMLEVGATATAYEPYTPITETDISFPSPVYGGTLDVVSGVMNVPVAFAEFDGSDDESWNVGEIDANKSRAFIALTGAPKTGYNREIIGNYIKPTASAQSSPDLWTANINASGNILIGIDPSITTVEAWKAYLAEHPLQIVYPLATPQEQTLTGHQITALKGDNTIWSDADGSMTAVYLKKGVN